MSDLNEDTVESLQPSNNGESSMNEEVIHNENKKSDGEENKEISPPKPSKAEDNAKKRVYVIQEIVSTELTYVERLRLVLNEIFTPLQSMKILDDGDVLNQFHGLELIYNLHARHSINGSTSQNLKFVDLFDDVSDNVGFYSEYLANYEPAMQRRAQLLVANRKFADFVDKAEKERLFGQTLESFLILPVQRIPRYRLLLDQLIKYTPEDHLDYATVKLTYDKICEMAAYNNEAIRARENRNKVMEIMMLIEPSTRVDLMANKSRQYVKDSMLLRQCRKRYKEFHFWLFNDELLYGEKGPLGGYALNRRLPLHRCKLKQLDIHDPEAKIAVVFESPQKSFKIKFRDEAEKKEWEQSLSDTIADAKAKLAAQGHENDDAVAPLWKPDAKATTCERCNAGFSLLFRRHHCRNCGIVVCVNCSSQKFLLKHVNATSPVRVCDSCYYTLSSANSMRSSDLSAMGASSKYIPGLATVESDDEQDQEEDAQDIDNERDSVVSEEDLNAFNEFMNEKQQDESHRLVTKNIKQLQIEEYFGSQADSDSGPVSVTDTNKDKGDGDTQDIRHFKEALAQSFVLKAQRHASLVASTNKHIQSSGSPSLSHTKSNNSNSIEGSSSSNSTSGSSGTSVSSSATVSGGLFANIGNWVKPKRNTDFGRTTSPMSSPSTNSLGSNNIKHTISNNNSSSVTPTASNNSSSSGNASVAPVMYSNPTRTIGMLARQRSAGSNNYNKHSSNKTEGAGSSGNHTQSLNISVDREEQDGDGRDKAKTVNVMKDLAAEAVRRRQTLGLRPNNNAPIVRANSGNSNNGEISNQVEEIKAQQAVTAPSGRPLPPPKPPRRPSVKTENNPVSATGNISHRVSMRRTNVYLKIDAQKLQETSDRDSRDLEATDNNTSADQDKDNEEEFNKGARTRITSFPVMPNNILKQLNEELNKEGSNQGDD